MATPKSHRPLAPGAQCPPESGPVCRLRLPRRPKAERTPRRRSSAARRQPDYRSSPTCWWRNHRPKAEEPPGSFRACPKTDSAGPKETNRTTRRRPPDSSGTCSQPARRRTIACPVDKPFSGVLRRTPHGRSEERPVPFRRRAGTRSLEPKARGELEAATASYAGPAPKGRPARLSLCWPEGHRCNVWVGKRPRLRRVHGS